MKQSRAFSTLTLLALSVSSMASTLAVAQPVPGPMYFAGDGVPASSDGATEKTAKAHTTTIAKVDGVVTIDEDGPQVKDDLFDGTEKFAAKAKESNEVNLDRSMLSLAGKKDGSKGDLARKLEYVVVRNYEFASEGDYSMADVATYFKKLDSAGWKHLVRTRSAKESTDICVKQDAEGVTQEMVIISAEPKELSLVHLKGNVNMADVKGFGGLMNGAMNGKTDAEPKLQKR